MVETDFKQTKKKDNFLWKLGFMLLLGVIIGLFLGKSVLAFDTGFVKWTLCDQQNLTRWDCDSWWQDPTNPYWIQQENSGVNSTNFYNKSEVDKLLNQINSSINNLNNTNSSLNLSGDYINQTSFDKWAMDFREGRDNISVSKNEFEALKTMVYGGKNFADDNFDLSGSNLAIIIFGVVILGGGFYYVQKNKKQKNSFSGNNASSELEKELAIKQQLVNLENKKMQQNPNYNPYQPYQIENAPFNQSVEQPQQSQQQPQPQIQAPEPIQEPVEQEIKKLPKKITSEDKEIKILKDKVEELSKKINDSGD